MQWRQSDSWQMSGFSYGKWLNIYCLSSDIARIIKYFSKTNRVTGVKSYGGTYQSLSESSSVELHLMDRALVCWPGVSNSNCSVVMFLQCVVQVSKREKFI